MLQRDTWEMYSCVNQSSQKCSQVLLDRCFFVCFRQCAGLETCSLQCSLYAHPLRMPCQSHFRGLAKTRVYTLVLLRTSVMLIRSRVRWRLHMQRPVRANMRSWLRHAGVRMQSMATDRSKHASLEKAVLHVSTG